METIATYSFPHEAHLARILLETEEIPVTIADEYTINLNWLYSNALGGVKVQVPRAYKEFAKDVLLRDYTESLIADKGYDEFTCNKCGKNETVYIVKGARMAFLSQLVIGFPLWPIKKQIKCLGCGAYCEY